MLDHVAFALELVYEVPESFSPALDDRHADPASRAACRSPFGRFGAAACGVLPVQRAPVTGILYVFKNDHTRPHARGTCYRDPCQATDLLLTGLPPFGLAVMFTLRRKHSKTPGAPRTNGPWIDPPYIFDKMACRGVVNGMHGQSLRIMVNREIGPPC